MLGAAFPSLNSPFILYIYETTFGWVNNTARAGAWMFPCQGGDLPTSPYLALEVIIMDLKRPHPQSSACFPILEFIFFQLDPLTRRGGRRRRERRPGGAVWRVRGGPHHSRMDAAAGGWSDDNTIPDHPAAWKALAVRVGSGERRGEEGEKGRG